MDLVKSIVVSMVTLLIVSAVTYFVDRDTTVQAIQSYPYFFAVIIGFCILATWLGCFTYYKDKSAKQKQKIDSLLENNAVLEKERDSFKARSEELMSQYNALEIARVAANAREKYKSNPKASE